MQGNRKNIILGVISIICLIALVAIIFRSGKPAEVKYTGKEIPLDGAAQAELSPEQLQKIADGLPQEIPQMSKPSALYDGESPKPKMANNEIAKIQSEAVKETKQKAIAARNTPEQNLSPEEKARLDQIREMRKKQAEKKKR